MNLPGRLAREAMENTVRMKGLEASIALAICAALDAAARVAHDRGHYAAAAAIDALKDAP